MLAVPSLEAHNHVLKAPLSYGMLLPSSRSSSPVSSGRSSPLTRRVLSRQNNAAFNEYLSHHITASLSPNIAKSKFSPLPPRFVPPKSNSILDSYSVSDVLKAGQPINREFLPVLTLNETETIEYALELFTKTSSAHALVRNSQGCIIGTVHLSDLIAFCCDNYRKWNTPYDFTFNSKILFHSTPISQLINYAYNCSKNEASASSALHHSMDSDCSIPCTGTKLSNSISFLASVSELARLISHPEIPNVLVIGDDSKDVLAVITRKDLIRFLYAERKTLSNARQVCTCRINYDSFIPVVSKIEFVTEAFEALWMMQNNGSLISHGKCVVDKFLNLVMQLMMVDTARSQIDDNALWVYESDLVEKALEMLGNRNVQRIFVKNADEKIIGEILITDFIGQFCL